MMQGGAYVGYSGTPLVDYGVALADAPAQHWMQARGYRTDSSGSFRLFADSVMVDNFGLTRVWHSPASLYREWHSKDEGTRLLSLLVAVEGTITVRADARELTASTNEAILLPQSTQYTIECAESSARIEVLLDDSFSNGYSLELDPARGRVLSASPYLKLLVASANTALGTNLVPTGIAGISLKNSFEHLTLAALRANESQRDLPEMSHNERIYTRALEIIESSAGRSTLTVASVADELRLSVRQLQRVFAVADTSPLAEIRVARARLAQQKLHSMNRPSPSEMAVVARSAGFSSTRSMRDALRLVDHA